MHESFIDSKNEGIAKIILYGSMELPGLAPVTNLEFAPLRRLRPQIDIESQKSSAVIVVVPRVEIATCREHLIGFGDKVSDVFSEPGEIADRPIQPWRIETKGEKPRQRIGCLQPHLPGETVTLRIDILVRNEPLRRQ